MLTWSWQSDSLAQRELKLFSFLSPIWKSSLHELLVKSRNATKTIKSLTRSQCNVCGFFFFFFFSCSSDKLTCKQRNEQDLIQDLKCQSRRRSKMLEHQTWEQTGEFVTCPSCSCQQKLAGFRFYPSASLVCQNQQTLRHELYSFRCDAAHPPTTLMSQINQQPSG